MDIRSIGINSIHNGSYKVDREAADNEFMLILMKSRGIFTLNGAEEIAEKGMAVILDGSERICYRADESVFIYDWIVFDGRADSDITAEMPVNKLICHTDQEYLSGIIRNIGIEFYSLNPRRGKTIELLMKMLLLKLSESQMFLRSVQQNTDPHYSELAELREKIYRNPQLKWSVDIMASEVNMSRSYFQHIYRETFGVSCITDVISGKIEKAKELLSETTFTVSQVSLMCGYDNEEHFMRQFKKMVGVTPTKYRKK